MNIENEIREIRNQLRLSMNGVASTSMREKGMKYRLNFGVSIPDLKLIASTHERNAQLAEALWKEDIREFKLLATMIQPTGELSKETAKKWIAEAPYMEVAEALSRNVLRYMPEAKSISFEVIAEDRKDYNHCAAYLTLFYWLSDIANVLTKAESEDLLTKAVAVVNANPLAPFADRQSATNALRAYGLQSKKQAAEVMDAIFDMDKSGVPEHKETLDQLKFEFEYSF